MYAHTHTHSFNFKNSTVFVLTAASTVIVRKLFPTLAYFVVRVRFALVVCAVRQLNALDVALARHSQG